MQLIQVKKKNGQTVYRASVYLGTDQVTGKKVKTSVTGRTKAETKQKARHAVLDFERQGQTRHQKPTITSYKELADLWWDSYKHTVKVNTRISVRSLLDNQVLKHFAPYPLDKLTPPLIQSIINKLADQTNKGEKGAYLHYDKIHALNKRILQYGVVMQAIPFNPAREIILPRNTQKASKRKIKHFTNQELKIFLDYLENLDTSKYLNIYEKTLYKFLLATGCRIGETLALEWSDIDLEGASVSITKTLNREGKTNTPKSKTGERVIDLDGATVKMLKEYKHRQTLEGWKIGQTENVVFSDFIHCYPSDRALVSRLATRLKSIGLPFIGFHGFRHTHASLLLNSGIPYKELQTRLGHSNLSITMDVYSHLSKENAKKAVTFYETALTTL